MNIASMAFNTLASYVAASRVAVDPAFPRRIQFWIDQFQDRDITTITAEDIEDAVDALVRRGKTRVVVGRDGNTLTEQTTERLANSTLNRYIATLGSVFRQLRNERILRRSFVSPLRGFGRLKESGGKTLTVTVEEVKRLIAACRLSRNRKLAALVAMACTTGWRMGNLTTVCWGDIDLDEGIADTSRTKNGTPHRAVLLPWVISELKSILPERPGAGERVFDNVNISKAFATALRRADLPEDWTPHSCRHIAASVLSQSGASIQTVMAALNHKTPAMALRYSHLNTKSLRDSMGRAWA
jgi:integrase